MIDVSLMAKERECILSEYNLVPSGKSMEVLQWISAGVGLQSLNPFLLCLSIIGVEPGLCNRLLIP